MATQTSPISVYVDRWRRGEPPNAHAVLREHPELACQKSFVLDLAYEEFCLRAEAGEPVTATSFCERFPTFRKSLARMLGFHEYADKDPELSALTKRPRWPSAGDEFLGFALLEELGRGAFARVFLATQPELGDRQVAIKISSRGAREAEIMGQLEHPNIVLVHLVREDPATGLTALCMPFWGSATLCDILDRAYSTAAPPRQARLILEAAADRRVASRDQETLAERERFPVTGSYTDGILQLGVQLCRGMARAHSAGILHRDLKPSNVLITPDGRAMLLDFNLSSDAKLHDLRIGGTLPYAAPELLGAIFADGNRCPVDVRSDVYSLGVVLYELLSGSLPFGAGVVAETAKESVAALLAVRRAGAIQLFKRVRSLDRAISRVIERCLEFDPTDRPRSAEDLGRQLAGCLTPRRRLVRWGRQHRAATVGAAVVALGLLSGSAALVANRDPYYLREYQTGRQALAEHQFGDAVLHFDHALEAKAGNVGILFARGQAFQQKGDFDLAVRDYRAAAERSPVGIIEACHAYCLAQDRSYRNSIDRGLHAIACGSETAEVYNNIGYCRRKLGEDFLAQQALDKAVGLNPDLQVAYYNRGLLEFARVSAGKPVATGLGDFERAIQLGPRTGSLYFDAACMNAAVPESSERRTMVVSYLRDALTAGFPPATVRAEPLLAPYRQHEWIKQLLAGASESRQQPAPPTLLAAPVISGDGFLPAQD